ncbi:MAG TPA: NAD(P)-dependent oxidoreductase [Pyrinomonadaceae bacterium]
MSSFSNATGMEVLISEHGGASKLREGQTRFEEVPRRSDVLTPHVLLKEETRNLFGREELSLM